MIETRLRAHLEKIAIPRNPLTHPEGYRTVRAYIASEFQSLGYAVERHHVQFEEYYFENIIATLGTSPGPTGSGPSPTGQAPVPASVLIIGAHYDAVPDSPGADDNASGLAVLLEAARLWREAPPPLPSPSRREGPPMNNSLLSWAGPVRGGRGMGGGVDVQFVAFDLEEFGMLGSEAYAKKLKAEGRKVAGMLSLEMVGYTSQQPGSQKYPAGLSLFYPSAGNFIGLIGNVRSLGFLRQVRRAFKSVEGLAAESLILPGNGRLVPAARLSDHAPFWDLGFPAVMVTDTSFYRNPFYHGPHDTIDRLDLLFMARVTKAVSRLGFMERG